MNHKLINRIIGAIVFLTAFIVYSLTVQPSVSFWDCGEFIAASYYLQVPHPPGAPLFLLIGRLFMMVPFVENLGLRMNYVSVISTAFTAMFLYFIVVKLITFYKNRKPENLFDAISYYGSGLLASITYIFLDTVWFNAVEAEVYAISMFFVGIITWLLLVWYEKAEEPQNEKLLLLIMYIIGLASGVHLLSVLAIFTIVMVVYFRKYEFSFKTFVFMGIFAVLFFWAVYPGIIKFFPSLLAKFGGNNLTLKISLVVLFTGLLVYGMYWTKQNQKALAFLVISSLFLIFIGYTSYTMVIIRANAHPPMNENEPDTMNEFVYYINREQYGDFPLLKRRYSQEPHQQGIYYNYSSDLDFMWRYQINHMYNRYLFWNFVGREGDVQDAKTILFGKPNEDFVGDPQRFPNRYFAIPFIFGLIGLYYHFRRDWKLGLSFFAMFLLMGVLTALYQNQQEPQPRERDYFYVGSFFVFAIWIGIAFEALLHYLKTKLEDKKLVPVSIGVFVVSMAIIPVNMAIQNWDDHDRSNNFIPWDFAYNILQSCEPNAILFTNGDNDTFPLWYLQDVEGVRRDIRIVNLSLANTNWYIKQAKNEEPYGAMKVPISFSDEQIDKLIPMEFSGRDIEIPVSDEVIEKFGVKDSSVIKNKKIIFRLNPPLQYETQVGPRGVIRVQDMVVQDIIVTNAKQGWKRPIHFSVTCSDDSKLGLDDYMKMQGMTFLVTPVKNTNMQTNIDVEKMEKCLFNEPEGFYKDYHLGFKFRGINTGKIYLDENQRRMIMNYRNSFLRLALYYMNNGNNEMLAKTLDEMEKKLPRKYIPLDYRLLSDIASLYKLAGSYDRFLELSDEIEIEANKNLELFPGDLSGYYNPYRILLQVYEGRGDIYKERGDLNAAKENYQNAIELLERIKGLISDQKLIDSEITRFREKMEFNSKQDTLTKK
ncbi:MAG: DUF2723 domain-containing protein [Ignavibacteria bacterium]|nr:DUF2723 domain-containing protein [Ignavibacteria bacterium]